MIMALTALTHFLTGIALFIGNLGILGHILLFPVRAIIALLWVF